MAIRLPSGGLAPAPLRWRDIVKGEVRTEQIAYVLARLIEARLSKRGRDEAHPDLSPSHLAIAYWETVPSEAADALHLALATTAAPNELTDAALSFRYGEFSAFTPGQCCVLLVDTLLTGQTAAGLICALRRMDADPVIVAALVDGRAGGGGGLDIQTFAGQVPVVSCFQKKLAIVETDYPEHPAAVATEPWSGGRLNPETFMMWLRESSEPTLRVGHIDRGPQRHLSTYLDVRALIAAHRADLRKAYESMAREFLGVHGESASVKKVNIVHKAHSFASEVAEELASVFQQDLGWESRCLGASRKSGSQWQLEGPALEPGFLGVVVDWGAVTSRTVRELIRETAKAGAEAVQAMILTSQLDDSSEHSLRETAAIRVRSQPVRRTLFATQEQDPTALETKVVPVRYESIIAARMGIYSSRECELCQVAQTLRGHAANAPTQLLRAHALKKFELLRPKTREEIFSSTYTDLMGSPLTPSEAAEIWRVRQSLEACRTSVSARAAVAKDLLGPVPLNDIEAWKAWIRLLTAESYWLKRAPLNQALVRSQLASICLKVLGGEHEDVDFTPALQWQAAILLRCSSKQLFLERFGEELVRASRYESSVAAELCLGMHTLLEAPYHRTASVMNLVLRALQEATETLGDPQTQSRSGDDLGPTLSYLYWRAVTSQQQITLGDDTAAAWHALKNGYARDIWSHHGALTSMLAVLNAFTGPAIEARARGDEPTQDDYWPDRVQRWQECVNFLSGTVFPYLQKIREPIESIGLRGERGREVMNLFQLTPRSAADFADKLSALAHDPTAFSEDLRSELEKTAFQWSDGLLKRPTKGPATVFDEDGYLSTECAMLLSLLHRTPSVPASAWRLALSRAQEAGLRIRRIDGGLVPDIEVFCDGGFLVDLFGQIIENAAIEKHASGDRPEEGVAIDVSCLESDPDKVTVIIRNDTSRPSPKRGTGMSSYGQRLRDGFNGALTHRELVGEPPWTYFAAVTLRRWR